MSRIKTKVRKNMWVIKLGGSLLGSQELQGWLDAVERLGDGKVIIVPGGGVFADAVRQAQRQTQIQDNVAHQMAVMAMDQFGVLMTGLNKKLVTASTELELAERGWQHRGIVWLPSHMVCSDDAIPMSWDVTSDSLAAWLAHKVEASHLILVKSSLPDAKQISIEQLISQDVVDNAFSSFASDAPFKTWLMEKGQSGVFSKRFHSSLLEKHALVVGAEKQILTEIAA